MKYSCNHIFMVRTPSLPANVFSSFIHSSNQSVEEFLQENNLNDFINKSILISSRELFAARTRDLHKKKKQKGRELSLFKFLTRAATRPTPYGLFAGVGLGEFSTDLSSGKLVLNEDHSHIECRVDSAWIARFVYQLETNPLVYPHLQVKFNHNCYVSGDRLKNPHYSNHGFVSPKSIPVTRNHIRNTPLVTYVKQVAKDFIGYTALKDKIQSQYPGVPEETILSTINTMVDNEILLTNLRVPSNCDNGIAYLLRVLKPVDGIAQEKEILQKIDDLLRQLELSHSTEDLELSMVQSIYSLLDDLIGEGKTKDLLVVNKGIVLQQNNLPLSVKDTIESFVEGLTFLQVEVPSPLERFKQHFQEEYGSHIEVPLCEIIDQNGFNGLSYVGQNRPIHDEKDQQIREIVDEKILYCLQSHEEEIQLSQQDFAHLRAAKEETLPASFDINFFITENNGQYDLSVAPIGGSGSAGNMFNRFAAVLDKDMFQLYKRNNHQLSPADPDAFYIEIQEGSTQGRLSNINNHDRERQFYIALATHEEPSVATELFLDDLLVGMQNGHLYLKSKQQGKRCKINHNCMINPSVLSEITKFLLYVSSDEETSVLTSIYRLFQNNYVYTPRIRYEGVVVHPKSWYLSAHLFDLQTQQTFEDSFQHLRCKYHIDDVVYLTEMDNRLALHLDKPQSQAVLYKQLQKGKTLRLTELEQGILSHPACLDRNGAGYVTEISCSLIKTVAPSPSIMLHDEIDYTLQNENRTRVLLQDGWIYAKLYQMEDRENEVLRVISASLKNIGNPKFFFLRYSDEIGRHLRVRFKYHNEVEANTHLPAVQNLFSQLQARRMVNKILFDIYFRENNRYGGAQLITLAEEVFFADSQFVICLLDSFDLEKEDDLGRAYLLGICTILSACFSQLEEMLAQVSLVPASPENKQAFRAKKKEYIALAEQILSGFWDQIDTATVACILERKQIIQTYWNALLHSESSTNTKEDAIYSIIHMFCNRLTGKKILEEKFRDIIQMSLFNIYWKQKH